MIFTVGTLFGTTNTTTLIATAAVRRTFRAVITLTEAAKINVISTHNISAIVAGLTAPIDKSNIWAIWVVGIQDASDHCEKVREPSLLKSSSYCDTTITFTKFFATDMWMRNCLICSCRIRRKSDYIVRTRRI